ncbi:MAG: transcription-repair coupling factor [Phycisphaerales bacterium]
MSIPSQIMTSDAVRRIAGSIAQGRRVSALGSHGSSAAMVAASVAAAAGRLVVLVVAHLDDADEAVDELVSAGIDALRFPALELLPAETNVSIELFGERLGVVKRVLHPGSDRPAPWVLVCPIQSLMQGVPRPDTIEQLSRTIRIGDTVGPGVLARWLEHAGYQRLEAIEEPGDFAVRGGIVDVFPTAGRTFLRMPPGSPEPPSAASQGAVPVRIDFFGDEVDTISEIDLDTMASDRAVDSVELVSASLDRVQDDARVVSLLDLLSEAPRPRDASGGGRSRQPIAILHETLEVTEQARGYYERVSDARGIFNPPSVLKRLQEGFAFVELNGFSGARVATDVAVEIPVSPLPPLPKDAADAVREVASLAGSHQVRIFCQNAGELQRLGELLAEHAPDVKDRIEAVVQYLHRGFIWGADPAVASERALVLLPYHELLHRFESRRGRQGRVGGDVKIRAGRAIDTFLDFAVGDFVVHRDHGIARFLGVSVMPSRPVQRELSGKELDALLPSSKAAQNAAKKAQRLAKKGIVAGEGGEAPDEFAGMEEFLALEFAKHAKLYVPATKIDQVQKYVGGFRGSPQLSALGGERWRTQKERVGEAVKDLAAEMLRIRAAREHLPGITYPGDTAWQKEFEAEFPFEETDDQLAALAEIKRDMAGAKPMDRLICGDVGFGKTELAIRAAFKAVEYGKQVAVLVPTTVLAEQHGRTFSSRFADYPFTVESLSRFKTTKEENDILARLRKGQVDVVIGTHRLLSKDVKFADLGLVVIDEEQRFGVEHKERLLSLRMTVDVMTLSATPIPRTLHLSMLGLRDISSLTTAPIDRRAVVTEVIPYNTRRIQAAIARELARNGQVFFVHNRVHNILSVADEIQKLAPDARIVVGHGQMPDRELEDVMLTFMRRQADILVSTTIIESGIDIPTANTMIINDADRFGLSDLHQLRGRVGRYKHRAYCYLLLPENRAVQEKALKRLKAIEEFSMLGAGFKIAMRDLEIRGAGNILGPEQSGHIATVGYEMYCQLLDRAVKELKNEVVVVPSETALEIGVTGLIPKAYIPSDQRRMEAYRRIALVASRDELARVEQELRQAYGDPPPATRRLLELAEIRAGANRLEIRSLTRRGPDIIMRVPPQRLQEVVNRFKGAADDPAPAQSSPHPPPAARPSATHVRPAPATTTAERASRLAAPTDREALGSAEPWHVVGFPPKKGEELCEVYARPPAAYMQGTTLLGVLRSRLRPR